MRTLTIILLLVVSNLTIAQTTAIPDPIFEQALINDGYDSAPIDGTVLTANINTVTYLLVYGYNISDLTGIEAFTSLTYLDCSDNLLTTIDISNNSALETLNCSRNQLTYLDVSQNMNLLQLSCYKNLLTSLDVTQNPQLYSLQFHTNLITSIDVTQNPLLVTFNAFSNQLTSLDISQNPLLDVMQVDSNQLNCLNVKNGNNTNIPSIFFRTIDNPNLTCIEVDNVAWSTSNWTNIDTQTSFSTSCPNPCTVGIKENNFTNLSIYPNPTSGQINISLEDKTSGSLRVLNSLGQVVLEEEFEGIRELNISLDEPSGLYFLQVEIDGEIITKKVVKE